MNITRINTALTSLFIYTEQELKNKPISTLFTDPDTYDTIITQFEKTGEIRNQELTMKTKTGQTKTVSFSASIVRGWKSQKLGVTCIINDLTSRKEMEQKLLKAERFASIGELAGMIGHDLRNPLTSIQGAIYYLKRKCTEKMDPECEEMLVTIEKSVQYANKIVRDLTDYSGDIKLEPAPTTPKQLLANALALTPPPANVNLTDLTDDSQLVVDASQMYRVFINIIKNAFDAMPNGGTLTITSTPKDDEVEISFQDTGVGMSEETLNRIWTLLFTTKAKGMGFGLPICKRIVEAHGGKINATSTQNKGTTITLTLPTKPTPK
jgi:PAS domain S-box-containing protein